MADTRTHPALAAHGLVMPGGDGDGDVVHGELVAFADPARDLPPLDRLEGFRPDGGGPYRRALAATEANRGVEAAWVYHTARGRRGQRLRGGVWPEVHSTALRQEQ